MENITPQAVEQWAEGLLATCDKELTKAERSEQLKYATLIQNPTDKIFLSRLLDESSQIRDRARLAERIKVLIDKYGVPKFFSPVDSAMFKAYQWLGYKLDAVSVPIFKNRLRADTRAVIIDEARPRLTEHLASRYKKNVGQNVNLLGEVVVGDAEADKRYAHYLEALKEKDINYISIKLSGIYAQMAPLNFVQARRDLVERISAIYQAAIDNPTLDPNGVMRPKFVNLDMEEYKDAHLTLSIFKEVLSLDKFRDLEAGIVVQAYLPDAELLQGELLDFARHRVATGGSPIKMRLVKGANLQMESVVSSLRGWENPVRSSKTEVDAAYLHLLDIGLRPENVKVLHLGVASHNLFSIGYAFLTAQNAGVEDYVTFEMLEGMAPNLWRAMASYGAKIILYTPVVSDEHFLNAVSYLVRRLDENTGPENFLSYSFGLKADSKEWKFLTRQFQDAYAMKERVTLGATRKQDRLNDVVQQVGEKFVNEPDTNFDLLSSQRWAEGIVKKWEHVMLPEQSKLSADEIKAVLATADSDPSGWGATSLEHRAEILDRAAENLALRRGDLIGLMAAVTGKTITEGDVEVSEAVDFCRFYPRSMKIFDTIPDLTHRAEGTVLVLSPWNFPLAIAWGGVSAALAAGNRVILKPATVAAEVMIWAARAFWDAGVPREALQVVVTADRAAQNALTTSPTVRHIVLTGGTDTAQKIAISSPTTPLSAETGGKNAIILTSSGDRDKAIMNTVASAFSNAGQKCSACSLLLVEREIFDDPTFKEKLRDAALSMHTGTQWDLGTMVGPMISADNEKLQHALTNPLNAKRWLIAPEFVDADHKILRPTILWGVTPDDFEFRTELFAPLLSVAVFDTLDQAIDMVSSLDYGLTSGLQSLDEREIELWKSRIVAGNLYINRSITGAIVSRQPFGGMKLSAFGGGIKAGGVNYVSSFMTFASSNSVDDYAGAYAEEFAKARDEKELYGEQNIFRYLPLKSMVLRVMAADSIDEVKLALKAAAIARTPLTVSVDASDPKIRDLRSMDGQIVEQNLWEFIASIASYDRVRVLSPSIPLEIYQAAAGLNKYIATAPVVRRGRVELLHYLKEQSIAHEYHRYGSITEIPTL
ncbi:MAG: bifunctional proline dehydrogenase/L-glutamate gamma-semialdehyde dehydrogenase [Mucinivorans sp.]